MECVEFELISYIIVWKANIIHFLKVSWKKIAILRFHEIEIKIIKSIFSHYVLSNEL